MEGLELTFAAFMILGILVSLVMGMPMRKHLLAKLKVKRIGLFQMPFYLKDYQAMIGETTEASEKRKYRIYLTVFLVSNLTFVIFAILLLLTPGSTL